MLIIEIALGVILGILCLFMLPLLIRCGLWIIAIAGGLGSLGILLFLINKNPDAWIMGIWLICALVLGIGLLITKDDYIHPDNLKK